MSEIDVPSSMSILLVVGGFAFLLKQPVKQAITQVVYGG